MAAVYISYVRPVDFDTVSALLAQCNAAIKQGFTDIHLLISSSGGGLIPWFGAYNQLLGLPVNLTTHNIGSIDSVANILFLAGRTRLACSASSFLFHGTHWNFGGTSTVSRPQLAEIADSLDVDEGKLKDIISLRSNIGRADLDRMMLAGETLNPVDAQALSVIHNIQEVNIPGGSPVWQI